MTGPRPVAIGLGLVLLAAITVWFLSRTPGSLLNDNKSDRFGPTPQTVGQPIIISVEEGETAGDIGQKLVDAGIIQSSRLFTTLAALMGASNDLQAGDYEFRRGTTAVSAVQRMRQGRTAAFSLTIREGLRAEEIADLLEEEGIVPAGDFRAALNDSYDAAFLSDPSVTSLEGFLFPATYDFPHDISAHDIVQRMLDAFDDRYLSDIQGPLAASPLSLEEAVTLASIIEREAVVPEERPTIAAVFLNRLQAGIALQADPTVQYAVADDPASVAEYGYWKQELTAADLAIQSPYNTYVFPGLPPGPIANPGLDSILAALEPAASQYLYFVACQDGSGRHMFAETIDEHLQNIDRADRGECR